MLNDLLYHSSTHKAFHSLLTDKFIRRDSDQLDELPLEIKYVLVRLSSLGVLVFSEEKIELAEGMESWMQLYWNEVSKTWC